MEADYDVIILGAGAAGLSACVYTSRAMMKTLVLESVGSGGQLLITLLTGFLFWLIIKVEMNLQKLKFNFIRIKEGILTYLFRKTSQRSLMAEACK